MTSQNHKPANVIEGVVDRLFCVGCGVCAGLCPAACLEMTLKPSGDLQPVLSGDCTACGLCLRVCPFGGQDPGVGAVAQDLFAATEGIQYKDILGYVRQCHAGHVADEVQRRNAASGGLLTETLAFLFEQGLIDAAAVVGRETRNGLFCRYQVVESAEQARRASGSAYYPVEVSDVLRRVRESEKRWAIVALPCLAYALRLAQRQVPALKDRIRYVLGLTCGTLPNHYFTEYMISLAGVDRSSVTAVRYRGKQGTTHSSDFYFEASSAAGNMGRPVLLTGMPLRLWAEGCFRVYACNFCEDVFAETADMAFMDAWLPRYIQDPGGTNIVLPRRRDMADLLWQMASVGRIRLEPLDPEEVLASQKGAIDNKTRSVPLRMAWAGRAGRWYPPRRSVPQAGRLRDRLRWHCHRGLGWASKRVWVGVGRRLGCFAFHTALLPWRAGLLGLSVAGIAKRLLAKVLRR